MKNYIVIIFSFLITLSCNNMEKEIAKLMIAYQDINCNNATSYVSLQDIDSIMLQTQLGDFLLRKLYDCNSPALELLIKKGVNVNITVSENKELILVYLVKNKKFENAYKIIESEKCQVDVLVDSSRPDYYLINYAYDHGYWGIVDALRKKGSKISLISPDKNYIKIPSAEFKDYIFMLDTTEFKIIFAYHKDDTLERHLKGVPFIPEQNFYFNSQTSTLNKNRPEPFYEDISHNIYELTDFHNPYDSSKVFGILYNPSKDISFITGGNYYSDSITLKKQGFLYNLKCKNVVNDIKIYELKNSKLLIIQQCGESKDGYPAIDFFCSIYDQNSISTEVINFSPFTTMSEWGGMIRDFYVDHDKLVILSAHQEMTFYEPGEGSTEEEIQYGDSEAQALNAELLASPKIEKIDLKKYINQ